MTQTGYVDPTITTNYQPSAGPAPMNTNNAWTGQPVFPHATQQNHQATGFQQGQMQLGFQNQGLANQPMNLAQQIGGQQAMANMMFAGDRVPLETCGSLLAGTRSSTCTSAGCRCLLGQ